MKNTDHLMGAKFKSVSRFFARLASKFIKSANITQNFFFFLIKKRYQKRRISCWFWIRWKSFEKMPRKKVISKTSLTNMSKSEKSAFFRHVFANNFFGTFFQNFFNGFEISVKFCVFWHLFRFFPKKIFLRSY